MFCHECLRLVPQRGDGAYGTHRDRGGRRCVLSGKHSPDWLAALAADRAAVTVLWPIERVAEHLGVSTSRARDVLRLDGVRHVAARGGGHRGGPRYLYDPLDVDELVHRRAQAAARRARFADHRDAQLRALYAQARTVNGATPLESPARAASLELNRRLAELHAAGAPFPQLDAAVGARPGTVRRRLVRHGAHGTLPPSVAPYLGVISVGGRPRVPVP